jgi:tetratricopeptide (TPR) repeat protein
MRSWFLLFIPLMLVLISQVALPVWAHEIEGLSVASTTMSSQTISRELFEAMGEVQTLIDEKQITKAEERIVILVRQYEGAGYGLAQLLNLQAWLMIDVGRYDAAINNYEKIVAMVDAPDSFRKDTLLSLAQVYPYQGNYEQALHYAQHWFSLTPAPGADAYGLLAQLQYHNGKINSALDNVEKAISLSRNAGRTLQESWLQLLSVIYYQKENLEGMQVVLMDLLQLYPKPVYWKQLAGVFGLRENHERQLHAMGVAWQQRWLETEDEIRHFAQLLMHSGNPLEAAEVMRSGLAEKSLPRSEKNLHWLGSALLRAGESGAAAAVFGERARLTGKVGHWLDLAAMNLGNGDYTETVYAAEQALAGSNVPDKHKVRALTLRGSAFYYLQQYQQAATSFSKALELADTLSEEGMQLRRWRDASRQRAERLGRIAARNPGILQPSSGMEKKSL